MAKGTIALGQFRGKVGGQVLRVVEGQQVIQNYQPLVRNPRTAAQKVQRAALKTMGQLVRSFLSVIRISYGGSYAGGNFVKANISRLAGALTILTPDDVTVNYASLKLTNDTAGGLLTVAPGAVDFGETEHLQIRVPIGNVSVAPSLETSNVRIYAAAYCPDRGLALLSEPAAATGERCQIDCPSDWDGMEVHVWMFATCATGTMDEDAFDQVNPRLPYITSGAWYAGTGEVA